MTDKHIVPFDSLKNGQLPEAIRNLQSDDEDWGSGQSGGFPVLSIKGKVFRVKRGDEYDLVTRPDDPDEAATSLQVSIIRTNKGVARTYYATAYDEDSHEAPDCYSNDGVAPAADAENKQAKRCATCPHSQWGSRITESGKKGKACSEVKRVAVSEPGSENDPMLLRVPPTSLRNWDQYVAKLGKKGLNPSMVVTKIGFDPEAAHQLITFKPVGLVNDEMAQTIAGMRDEPLVLDIVGVGPNAGAPVDTTDGPEDADDDTADLKVVDTPAKEEAPKEKPQKAAPKPEPEPEEAAPEPDPEPEPKPKKAAVQETDAIGDDLDAMLSDLDFDD